MQLGLCPEAATHLQEMKDMLIVISNELLDNVNELSLEHIEKLRQDRFAFQLIFHYYSIFCLTRYIGSIQRK
jgi:hypothetical protein